MILSQFKPFKHTRFTTIQFMTKYSRR